MGYDSWENVGYKVIDKINSFDNILTEIREDMLELKKGQATLQIKMWAIGIGIAVFVALGKKIFGI